MKYRIQYNYDTGDSFKNEPDNLGTLEMVWENLDVAKKNLQWIKEHYSQYKELNSYSYLKEKSKQEILESNKGKDWFVKGSNSNYYDSENCIILYSDDGKPWQFWAPWCGYFESLNYAEIIIPEEENDMKISF